ncbi:MAG: hypothetical protein ACOYYS_02670 [Chloroflexota bacterium]
MAPLWLTQPFLQRIHRLHQLRCLTEQGVNLVRRTVPGKRLDAQQAGQVVELADVIVGVFLEQVVQNLAGGGGAGGVCKRVAGQRVGGGVVD